MQELPDAVTGLELVDEHGEPVLVGALRPALLVWLRHFGCLFCRQQAAHYAALLPDIEAKGSRLVFIGCGAPRFARAFRKDHLAAWPSITLLCDPKKTSYRALNLRRGLLSLLSPKAWREAWRLLRAGNRPTLRPQGDALQNGGVIVVDGSGGIRYRFLSQYAGHHPDPQAVLDSLSVELMLY